MEFKSVNQYIKYCFHVTDLHHTVEVDATGNNGSFVQTRCFLMLHRAIQHVSKIVFVVFCCLQRRLSSV